MDWIQAISVLGFPIVMCGAMAWYVKYITDMNRDQIREMNDTHKQEMADVTDALSNNTIAIQKLSDYFERS